MERWWQSREGASRESTRVCGCAAWLCVSVAVCVCGCRCLCLCPCLSKVEMNTKMNTEMNTTKLRPQDRISLHRVLEGALGGNWGPAGIKLVCTCGVILHLCGNGMSHSAGHPAAEREPLYLYLHLHIRIHTHSHTFTFTFTFTSTFTHSHSHPHSHPAHPHIP
ncbi:hypothetical protein DFP73DRAFT_376710 [Morchella snyderi]|nr:hypothetical protein DFP73DRAFT_376710 [Morchella snyderi]